MLKFLKKLLGLDNKDVWAPLPEPTVEKEKAQVVSKKAPKPVAKKEPKKKEKPELKVVKTEAKKRGRPAKAK